MSGQLSSWDSSRLGEIRPATREVLEEFSRRRARLQWLRGAAAGTVMLIGVMLIVAAIDHFLRPPSIVLGMMSLIGYGAAGLAAWRLGWAKASRHDIVDAARGLEATCPRLREQIVSAVELDQIDGANGSADFRQRLQLRVGQALSSVDVRRLLPMRMVASWILGVAGLIAVIAGLSMVPTLQMPRRLARAFLPIMPIQRASITVIHLRQPDPPTRVVAEGDLVAVVVDVQRLGRGGVTLEFRSDDGSMGDVNIAPRLSTDSGAIDGFNDAGRSDSKQTFAANLQVGASPMSYRIVAGDAETLWHTLSPMFRPRVVEFEKTIRFPGYANLPDETTLDERGDIEALVGSTADVRVRFDQPVENAIAQFLDGGGEVAMQPVEGDGSVWKILIPVKTPGSYRVDGASIQSGLGNPFTPRNTIDPIVDRPPVAKWSATMPERRVVSPAAVVSMSATAEDDLPIDWVVHQIVRDDGSVIERRLPVSPPQRVSTIAFQWDMAAWDGSNAAPTLARGSSLKTRMIAVDRAGRRGESDWIELLIAGEDFRADRHDELLRLRALTSRVTDWWTSVRESSRTAEQLDSDWQKVAAVMTPPSEPPTIATMLRWSDDSNWIEQWAAIDQSATRVIGQLSSMDSSDEQSDQDRLNDLAPIIHRAKRVEELAPAMLAVELAAGLRVDLMAAATMASELADGQSAIPVTRLPQQAELLAAHLREVATLIQSMSQDVPKPTRRHHQLLTRFITDAVRQIDEATTRMNDSPEPDPERPYRETMRSLAEQIRSHCVHAILEGQTFNTISAAMRELQRENAWVDRDAAALLQSAERLQTAIKKSEDARQRDDSDSAQRALLRDAVASRRADFQTSRDFIVSLIVRSEAVQRMRRDSDLQFAADLNLIERAMKHTTGGEDPELAPEIAPAGLDNLPPITDAARTLIAGADVRRHQRILQSMADRERFGNDEADRAVRQWIRLGSFQVLVEKPLNDLKRHGVEPSLIDKLQENRWNDEYSRARDLISSRSWSGDPMVSAALELESIADRFASAQPSIEPVLEAARRTLRSMLPTLSEGARRAAQTSAVARQSVDQPNAPEETLALMETLRGQVADVAEQLIDRSNVADLASQEQREAARDADAALAAMARQTKPDSDSLEALEKTLRAVAEHFQNLDEGKDASDSRQTLQEAANTDDANDPMSAESQAAQATAAAAQQTPEELLARLQRELKRNPPMRDELSDIAERITADAQRSIERAAQQEQSLRRSLEQSDDDFNERKIELKEQLASQLQKARAVERQWLGVAETAASRGDRPKNLAALQSARSEIRTAIDQAQQAVGGDALRDELLNASEAFSQAIARSAQQVKAAAEPTDETVDEDATAPPQTQRPELLARQLEFDAERTQNDWINALRREAQAWKQRTLQAGQRIRQAQNQVRQANDQLRGAKEQQAKHEGEEWAENALQSAGERLETAKQSVESRTRTRDKFEQQIERAQADSQAALSRSVQPLKSDDPAAEAMESATDQAARELTQIADQLRNAAGAADDESTLRLAPETSRQLASQQKQTRESVSRIAEELQRAARHEERLGRQESAAKLDDTARQISHTARSSMADAEEKLSQPAMRRNSKQDVAPENLAVQAGQELGTAAEQLSRHAQSLAELTQSASTSKAASSMPDAPADRSQKLARTLDELDRALNDSSQQGESQPGESQSGNSQSGNSQSGDSQAGNASRGETQSGDSNGGQTATPSPSAGQVSPTLAEAAEAALRQLAQRRQRQLSPITGKPQPGQSQQPGQPGQQGQPSEPAQPGQPSTPGPSAQPGTQSGDNSNMPGGGFLDAEGTSRRGDDWATLRDQQSAETIEDRQPPIPAEYRNAVRAYFEAIAGESARSEK